MCVQVHVYMYIHTYLFVRNQLQSARTFVFLLGFVPKYKISFLRAMSLVNHAKEKKKGLLLLMMY